MTLSESWLKNNNHVLEYVQSDSYNSEFISKEARKGGGVGVYVKDYFKYKIPKYIINPEPDTEHIRIELTCRNKNSSVLVGALIRWI